MYFLGPCRAPVTCFINFNKEAQTLCKCSSKFGSASTAKEVTALFLLPFVNIRSVLQPGIKYINLLEVLHFISCWPAPSRSIQYNLARPYPGDVQMTSGMRILAQMPQKKAEAAKNHFCCRGPMGKFSFIGLPPLNSINVFCNPVCLC